MFFGPTRHVYQFKSNKRPLHVGMADKRYVICLVLCSWGPQCSSAGWRWKGGNFWGNPGGIYLFKAYTAQGNLMSEWMDTIVRFASALPHGFLPQHYFSFFLSVWKKIKYQQQCLSSHITDLFSQSCFVIFLRLLDCMVKLSVHANECLIIMMPSLSFPQPAAFKKLLYRTMSGWCNGGGGCRNHPICFWFFVSYSLFFHFSLIGNWFQWLLKERLKCNFDKP